MILQASPAPAIDTFDFQEIPGVGLLITQSEQQHNNETKSTLTLTTYEDVASISQKSLPGSSQTICGLHVNGNEGGNFAGAPVPSEVGHHTEQINDRELLEADLLKAEYTEIKEVRKHVFATAMRSGVDHFLVFSAA